MMHVYVRGIILERRAGLKCASSRPVVQLEADVCMCGCFSEILNCLGGQTLRRIVWVVFGNYYKFTFEQT
ncbi:hypothetical protein D917_06432 [Trichinella nativa]|uniref:Uncharacterized protein n=1 Tax=Trichinella nativa TaxID=6335 RepID=A0A1Y3EXA1_9BILA|nr:hypothetical protein D917_06432 [Trichinella nativa]